MIGRNYNKKIIIAQIGASETTHAAQVFGSLAKQNDIFEIIGFADIDHHNLPLNCPTYINNIDSNDYGFAMFKYKNGISFAKTCSSEIGGFQRRQIVVAGSKGTVELNPIERYVDGEWMVTDIHEKFNLGWRDNRIEYSTETFDRYDAMMRGFAKIVRAKKPTHTPPIMKEDYTSLFLLLAALERKKSNE